MTRPVRIVATPKEPFDIERFCAALVELARQEVAQQTKEADPAKEKVRA
jgi:hypothetical protein